MEEGVGIQHTVSGSRERGWQFFRRRPCRRLAPWVVELHGYVEHGLTATVRKEIPVASIPVIFVFGTGFAQHENGAAMPVRDLRQSFAVGLHSTFSFVGSLGSTVCLQANLTLPGARRFFQRELIEISGELVDLNCMLDGESDRLEFQLEEAQSWSERFDTVEAFLIDRINKQPDGHPIATESCRLLSDSGGQMEITKMAAQLDCSRKHLNAVFKREVGMSAKKFARLQRFERAAKQLRSTMYEELSAIAYDTGFSDQAHFNREFLTFAGETPSKYRRRETENRIEA